MFKQLENVPKDQQELFKKILKYHFDWSPEEPTKQTRVKQVRTWVQEYVQSKQPKKR